MDDQAFLHQVVERAQFIAALEMKGRKFKARLERGALNSDLNYLFRHNPSELAMYEKIVMNFADEIPALPKPKPPKRRAKIRHRGR